MNKRKRNITIIITVLFLGFLLLGKVLAQRMRNHLNDLDSQITQLVTQRNGAYEELKSNNSYVEQWERISSFLSEPIEIRRANFIAYLQQLEKQSEILITSQGPFSARSMENRPQFQILSYKLNFSCDLKGLVEFLARLDAEDRRLLRIESLKITPRQRPVYATPPRYSQELSSTRSLSVEMTVSIPAVTPPSTSSESEKEMS